MKKKKTLASVDNLSRLIELNQERINEGICGDCFEELNKLRGEVASEFIPLVNALAASGVLSVFIPSDDEDAEPLEIVSAFECEHGGGLHLVSEDLSEDDTEPDSETDRSYDELFFANQQRLMRDNPEEFNKLPDKVKNTVISMDEPMP